MSDDWRADLNRLAECYRSWGALADALGYERQYVDDVYHEHLTPGEDFKEAVTGLREGIKSEHTIAASMDATMQQTLIAIKDADDMEHVHELVERAEATLSKQRQKLCDDS